MHFNDDSFDTQQDSTILLCYNMSQFEHERLVHLNPYLPLLEQKIRSSLVRTMEGKIRRGADVAEVVEDVEAILAPYIFEDTNPPLLEEGLQESQGEGKEPEELVEKQEWPGHSNSIWASFTAEDPIVSYRIKKQEQDPIPLQESSPSKASPRTIKQSIHISSKPGAARIAGLASCLPTKLLQRTDRQAQENFWNNPPSKGQRSLQSFFFPPSLLRQPGSVLKASSGVKSESLVLSLPEESGESVFEGLEELEVLPAHEVGRRSLPEEEEGQL